MRDTLEERVLGERLCKLKEARRHRLRSVFKSEYHKLKDFPQPVRDCPATGLLDILKADARMLVDNLGKTLGYNDIEQLEIVVNVVNPDFWEGGEEATFPEKYNIVLHTPPNDRRMRMELTVEPIERVLEVMSDAEIYGYYQVDYNDTPEKRECNDFTSMTFKTEEVLDLVKDIIKVKRLMVSICDRMVVVANTIGREEFIKELSKKDEEPRYDPTLFDDNGEDYEEDPHYLNRDHGLEI